MVVEKGGAVACPATNWKCKSNFAARAVTLLAARVAEELVTEYSALLGGVTLIPSSGGTFEVRAGNQVVFSLDTVGRFPEQGEVSRLMKDKQLLS